MNTHTRGARAPHAAHHPVPPRRPAGIAPVQGLPRQPEPLAMSAAEIRQLIHDMVG
ncbi:hypothetical protein LPC08_15785 [Roseomonas sp. OT10]|uniref:hypothetical protein n=1 Tax=Roseomonas cutis TaxID=2897332 RepID=UPI001E31134A|nr:hypothetical protein [Roseomonas sp. OT10]UFN47472.1 hypothetical protein LPC08_15785 [Roseomonas sp. OT10]